MTTNNQHADIPEKLLTIKQASTLCGIPYWKLLRAVNAGSIPSYTLLNTKRYLKLSDIERAIQQSQEVSA